MGPDGEATFSILFLVWLFLGLMGNPIVIVAGVAAGLTQRNIRLAAIAAIIAVMLVNLLFYNLFLDWSSGCHKDVIAMSIAASIWAALVSLIRTTTRSNDAL